ncbi:MAG: redoxin domain-containing protein [Chloroflexota bacterium]|nr:redoxin domain-containing protein [Chloroflexota bacterium]
MRQRQADLDASGALVYAVSFETPARLRAYVRLHQIPFPILADPARATYKGYGLGRGPWWRIYGPRVLWRYARAALQGRRITVKGDTLQRGGDFVVDGAGVLRLVHVGEDSFDRPPVGDVLQALAQGVH